MNMNTITARDTKLILPMDKNIENKLLLVDGSNLLFQMYYGMPARIVNSKGISIHGVLGFIGALIKIITYISPSHVAVIFDSECENERYSLDSEYKSNRPDFSNCVEEETPFFQLSYIYKCLDSMGITHFETEIGETDDVIASYTSRYRNKMEIYISSFDSDFFQLISDNTFVFRYKGKNSYICNVDYVKLKLGIEPYQYVDFKSLTGDKADNIKGADKIGVKTATELICTFGTLDNIIQNANEIKKPSIKASILASTERLKLNQRLITLCDNTPLPFELCSLYVDTESLKNTKTRDVLKKMEIL